MKFAKYLQEEAVPEWRKAYINYKQGKKLLKAIEGALNEIEAAEALKLGRIPVHDPEGSALERDPHHTHLHQQEPYDSPTSAPILDNTNTNRSDDSTPRTPIMTRPRGNSRNNYSTIIIAPPTDLPKSLSNQLLSPSLTICEDDQSTTPTTAASSGSRSPASTFVEQLAQEPQGPQPFQRVQPQRSGSSFSHLSQSAMMQSSQLLKNLSRRLTIIYTPELSNARARSIQGKKKKGLKFPRGPLCTSRDNRILGQKIIICSD